MPRRTLKDAKDSRIPEAVNLPPEDSRFVQYVNEAQEKLLQRGHWWGTMARYRISTTEGLITMPRQIASVEAAAVCNSIVPVHDFWYEWLANGWGPRSETIQSGFFEADYKGHYPTFSEIEGFNKALRIICDNPLDAGKVALIQGYTDSPVNWIRSVIPGSAGVFQSGEQLVIQSSNDPSVIITGNFFGRITDIQLPNDMQGQCWLYEYDTVTQVQRLIGQYEAYENRPSFARYLFPSILTTQTTDVEVLAKVEFLPVKVDSDYLIIGNLAALKMAAMSIKAEEELRLGDASILMNGGITKSGQRILGAIGELEAELDHFLGTGRRIGINVMGLNIGSVTPVETIL